MHEAPVNICGTDIYEKVDDSQSSTGYAARFNCSGAGQTTRFFETKSHLMKICITASACLVIGLLAPMAYAAEKPQRAERRLTDSKKGGAAAREPADIASKMLSEFDTDGDGIVSYEELRSFLGVPGITLSGEGTLGGGPATISAGLNFIIDPSLDVVIELGG